MSKSLKKLIDTNRLREFKNKLVGTGSAYVQTAAVDQTIAGTKTFSKPIVGSVTGSSGSCTGNAATATTATSVPWSGVTGKPSSYTPAAHTQAASTITGLATVATSGSYTDLSNKPTIPVIDSALSATSTNGLQNKVIKTALDGKANSSHTHTKSQITDFPALATVATSGSYNDLANKPAIPPAYSLPDATATVKGGVKIGSNITVSKGTVSLTKDNVVAALGYTPPTKDTNTWTAFKGATSSADGTAGYVPAPTKGNQDKFFKADGTWATPTNTTYSVATTSANGLMSATDKAKLDGIAAGANNYTHPSSHPASMITGLAKVATSGSYNDLANKPAIPTVNNATLTIQKNGTTVKTFTANASANVTANITVPTKVSELTNDSGFLTSHQSLSNYVTLNGAQTISGAKTFTGDVIGINKDGSTEDANSLYSTTVGSKLTYYTTSNASTKLANVPAAINTTLESRTIRRQNDSDWIVEQICHNGDGLYYRKRSSGTWGAWKTFAFTDSNISGNAANGVDSSGAGWIRFMNGVQICWASISCGSSGSSRWTYNAHFSSTSTPVVTVCDRGGNNKTVYLTRAADIGATSCLIVMVYESNGSYAAGSAQCIAIGRWK